MPKGDRLKLKADPEDEKTFDEIIKEIIIKGNELKATLPNESLPELRASYRYQKWLKQVMDNNPYCCDICGISPFNTLGIELHIHHIKSFSKYPDLRFDVNNGEILCASCHRMLHSFGE